MSDLDDFDVLDNDYPRFIEARGQVVLEKLQKRLNPVLD